MNIYKKNYVVSGVIISSIICSSAYGIIAVDTQQEFKRLLRKSDLVAALFYDQHTLENQDLLRRLKHTFRSVSKGYGRETLFVMVDVSKPGLQSLIHKYSLTTLPAILVFDDSHPVSARGGKIAMITGYVDRAQIKEFIEYYLGDIIQEKNQPHKPKKVKKKIVKTRVYTPVYRPYWGWRYGYPYAYGYYPYYRGYHRPYLGIGFGFGY